MKLKEIIWPHPIKTLKSYVIAIVIRHFFDETFSLSAFLAKTDQVTRVLFVSKLLFGIFDLSIHYYYHYY